MAWRGAEVGGGGPHIHHDIGVCTIHVEGVFVHVNKADMNAQKIFAPAARKKAKKNFAGLRPAPFSLRRLP